MENDRKLNNFVDVEFRFESAAGGTGRGFDCVFDEADFVAAHFVLDV